jgi:ABC-type dipeptide/oligopeptide/nickel transport system permease subunit
VTVTDLQTLSSGDPDADPADVGSDKAIAGKSPTRIALERLRSDKVAVISASIILIFVLLALFAPLISKAWGVQPEGASASEFVLNGLPKVGPPLHGFIWSHPFGVDPNTGNDLFARWLYGARLSLGIALTTTILTTIIGITVGLISGFSRGFLDRILSFFVDFFLAFPFLLGALAITPMINHKFADSPDKLVWAQIGALIFVLTILGWMPMARLIRGQVLGLREREFIQSAEVIGVPTRQILFKELLPNMTAPIIIAVSLALPAFVAAEAGLSFLGIGITGAPSWGQTINNASNYYDTYPLYLWPPVVGVAVLVLTLNLLGDSIRDAFDPKTRR